MKTLENYEREIVELHQFFEDWFNGRTKQTHENLARFTEVTAEGFMLITPQGHLLERSTIIDAIYQMHGKRMEERLWIENVCLCHHYGSIILAIYEEWQESGSGINSRLSTVLFRQKSTTPNGLIWLHVHETWMPQQVHLSDAQ